MSTFTVQKVKLNQILKQIPVQGAEGKLAEDLAPLIAMGEEELRSIIRDEGAIKVDCEFCNQHYTFDSADVDALTHPGAGPAPGTVLH